MQKSLVEIEGPQFHYCYPLTHLAKKPNQKTFIRTWLVSKTQIWPITKILSYIWWQQNDHLVPTWCKLQTFMLNALVWSWLFLSRLDPPEDNLHAHLVQNVNLKVKCTFVEFMNQFKTKSNRKTQSPPNCNIRFTTSFPIGAKHTCRILKTPRTSKSLARKKYTKLQDLPCKDAVAKQDHNLEWHKEHHNATPTYCKLQNDKLNGQLKS